MLLEFSVENFMSFKKISTLSMISSSGRELPEHVIHWGKSKKPNLSINRVAALFGANASGKSNFLEALYRMKGFVTRFGLRLPESEHPLKSEKPLQYTSFKLVPHDAPAVPTTFQVIFTSSNNIYRYGFSYTEKMFTREWLYVRSDVKKEEQTIFYRTDDTIECEDELMQHARHVTGLNLFLTVLAELNVDNYVSLISFFQNMRFRQGYRFDVTDIMSVIDEGDFTLVSSVLEFVDTGLSGVIKEDLKEDLDELKSHSSNIPEKAKKLLEALEEYIEPMIKEKLAYKILFQHNIFDNNAAALKKFNLSAQEESRGTIVFIGIIANIISALKNNSIIVIDELDASLHPLLVEGIIKLFINTEKSSAQILFSSHCPFIFDQNKIRRDELWVVEKNNGESDIFSASDFKARGDGNLAKQYMEGKFGGIPVIQYKHLETCSDKISALIDTKTQE
jgi:hypothetical protein